MRLQRGSLWLTGFVLLIALVAESCSKGGSSGTTAPPPGKEMDSGNIAANGGVYAHTFAKAGSFPYHCIYHGPMTGTIVVADSATLTSGSISIVSSSSAFPSIGGTLKTGSTVTWTNSTGAVHTVTSN